MTIQSQAFVHAYPYSKNKNTYQEIFVEEIAIEIYHKTTFF